MRLVDILKKIQNDKEYPSNKSWHEQNLYENYEIVSELLDANNAYEYEKVGRATWKYEDVMKQDFYVRINYIPDIGDKDSSYLEFKTYWTNDDGKPMHSDFNGKSTSQDLNRRSDTVSKIYRDEVIPFFKNQDLTTELRVIPVDSIRYRLFKMMVKKYTPTYMKIEYLDSYMKIIK